MWQYDTITSIPKQITDTSMLLNLASLAVDKLFETTNMGQAFAYVSPPFFGLLFSPDYILWPSCSV